MDQVSISIQGQQQAQSIDSSFSEIYQVTNPEENLYLVRKNERLVVEIIQLRRDKDKLERKVFDLQKDVLCLTQKLISQSNQFVQFKKDFLDLKINSQNIKNNKETSLQLNQKIPGYNDPFGILHRWTTSQTSKDLGTRSVENLFEQIIQITEQLHTGQQHIHEEIVSLKQQRKIPKQLFQNLVNSTTSLQPQEQEKQKNQGTERNIGLIQSTPKLVRLNSAVTPKVNTKLSSMKHSIFNLKSNPKQSKD